MNDEINARLALPLDPKRVATFESGPQRGIRYLEGEDVIRTANDIFGFGNWGFRLLAQPWLVESGTQGQKDTAYQVWAAWGEVEIAGAIRVSDIGTNTRSGTGSAGLEMAIKGSVTDCFKRCLRQLGDQFGLSLYDKHLSMRDLAAMYGEAIGNAPESAQEAHQPAQPAPSRAKYDWEADLNAAAAEYKAKGVTGAVIRHVVGLKPESSSGEMLAGIDSWFKRGGDIPELMKRAVAVVEGRA